MPQTVVTGDDGTWTAVGINLTDTLRVRLDQAVADGGPLILPLPLRDVFPDPCFGVAKVQSKLWCISIFTYNELSITSWDRIITISIGVGD